MPGLVLNGDSGKTFSLEHLRGVKVLVNFWAAYDAESHIKNVQFWNALQQKDYPMQMLSVSFDKSKGVYEKTLKLDGIDAGYHFYDVKGKDSEVYKTYKLDNGFKNYLLDENGVILAMDLNPHELENYFN